jgi:fatty acid amide hydrolase 2
LTALSAVALAAAIRERRVTVGDVVEAHIEVLLRTAWCNGLAARRFGPARDEAAAADELLATGTSDVPPWLGVPVTVKEMLAVAGMPNTAGMHFRRRRVASSDAPIVARLRAAGAIVLGVGNTPGPVPWVETNNWIYGRTSNAYDRRRTAGGSSGGDGAIVGSGGVPVALGSDMGGSVRIPAFMNGVFGHLPSPGLVPLTGHFPVPQGDFRRTLIPGPLTRRADDLLPLLRIISGPDGRDRFVTGAVSLGDDSTVSLRGLPVLISAGSSVVPPRREIQASIDDAAAALAAAGADVAESDLRRLRGALLQFAAVAVAELDVYESLVGIGGHVPPVLMGPSLVMRAVESAPARAMRTRAARRMVDTARRSADDIAATLRGGVLLHPPFPRLAPRHRTTIAQPWLVSNTAVFNLLGLPATQVPLGLSRAGLPLGVQVVAAPGDDHVTIAVARELERAFGGWIDPASVRRRGEEVG